MKFIAVLLDTPAPREGDSGRTTERRDARDRECGLRLRGLPGGDPTHAAGATRNQVRRSARRWSYAGRVV